MHASKRSLIKLLIVLMIWASTYAVTRNAVTEIPPVLFAFLRFIVASATMLVIYLARRKTIRKPATPMRGYVVLMGFTGITLYYVFFNLSLRYTSASVGALIQGFIPVGIAILAAVFLREKLSRRQVAGIAICLVGVVLLGFISPGGKAEPGTLLGNVLMMGTVVCWGVYTILSKKVAHTDSIWLTTWLTLSGTALLVPAVLFEMWGKPFPVISLGGWVAIGYLGVCCSAIAYLVYNDALKHISASRVGVLLNLDPVFGAVIAVLFLKEPLFALQIGGGFLVIAGVFINNAPQKDAS